MDPALHDTDLFLAIEDLDLVSRILVDGVLTGMHRSRNLGGGTEFHGYRDYIPGDDLRRVDWNLWARSDRLCTKVMRAETNMPLYVLLDASASMRTAHGPCRKWSWASRAAAALVLCALRGRDPAGMALLTDTVADFLPAKLGSAQFPDALALLERSEPAGTSDLLAALGEARTLCTRRGMVVLISDLFAADSAGDRAVADALAEWQASGQDMLVVHLLDPVEADFPRLGKVLTRDLESTATLRTDAATVHEHYADIVGRWRTDCRQAGEGSGLDWISVTTADSIADTLAATLTRRALLAP